MNKKVGIKGSNEKFTYCEICWYMLISNDERSYCCVIPKLSTKVFIIANSQVHLKSSYESLKTKWAIHIIIPNTFMTNTGGVLNFPSLVKFCFYVQNKVSHETGLACPPPLWTKTKNCPKHKSHLPQHHHSSHWVQSPIKSVLR